MLISLIITFLILEIIKDENFTLSYTIPFIMND